MEDSTISLYQVEAPEAGIIPMNTQVADPDIEFIRAFKNGEQTVFDEFIKKYKDRIYRIVFMMIQDKSEADDITQEVFLKVFTRMSTFKEKSLFFTWLYSVAVNECRHALRKKKHTLISLDAPLREDGGTKFSDLLESAERSPESRLIGEEQSEMLNKMINTLPEKYKTIYILKNIDGLSYNEIAGIMNISIDKVKVWLFRAREKLDEKLKPYYETYKAGGM